MNQLEKYQEKLEGLHTKLKDKFYTLSIRSYEPRIKKKGVQDNYPYPINGYKNHLSDSFDRQNKFSVSDWKETVLERLLKEQKLKMKGGQFSFSNGEIEFKIGPTALKFRLDSYGQLDGTLLKHLGYKEPKKANWELSKESESFLVDLSARNEKLRPYKVKGYTVIFKAKDFRLECFIWANKNIELLNGGRLTPQNIEPWQVADKLTGIKAVEGITKDKSLIKGETAFKELTLTKWESFSKKFPVLNLKQPIERKEKKNINTYNGFLAGIGFKIAV